MSATFNPFSFTGASSDLGGLNLGAISPLNGSTSFPFLENAIGASSGGANTGAGTGISSPFDFSSIGGLAGVGLGAQGVTDALGNTSSSSASPLSQIFTAIDNFFQRAGIIALGIILIAIGAYFLARPQVEAGVRHVKALAA